MNNKWGAKETLLAIWLVLDLVWGTFLLAGMTYLVFWHGVSAWWYIAVPVVAYQPTLVKALQKYFGVDDA